MNPEFEKAFAFLKRDDLATLPTGRHEIDGDRCWAIVNEVDLAPSAERKLEAHRSYIDIQAPVTASEEFGLCELNDEQLALPFDEKNDCVVFQAPMEQKTVQPGEFVIFFPPRCGHAPCCLPEGGQKKIRKVIIKVRA